MASSCFLADLYSQGIAAVLLFSSSAFSVATVQLYRASAVAVVHFLSQQSLPQLPLFLAHPANQPWSLDFVAKRRSSPFFLAAGSTVVE